MQNEKKIENQLQIFSDKMKVISECGNCHSVCVELEINGAILTSFFYYDK